MATYSNNILTSELHCAEKHLGELKFDECHLIELRTPSALQTVLLMCG